MRTIYLAGPITGLTYGEGQSWRDYVRSKLPYWIEGASPLRSKEYLAEMGRLGSPNCGVFSTNKAIVTRDRYDVQKSDLILMNLLQAKIVSIGTMVELGWADAFRKPVVLVMEPESNIHEHGFVREIAGFVVPNLDQAITVVQAILAPYEDSYNG